MSILFPRSLLQEPEDLILLASSSPRRRDLLAEAGVPFELVKPGPESAPAGAAPPVRALAAARSKAHGAVVAERSGLLLAADTVVAIDGTCLGKPRDRAEAARFLRRLSGREHEVWTAHVLVPVEAGTLLVGAGDEVLARSVVAMAPVSAGELAAYLDTDDWSGKAGAYGIQSLGGSFMRLVAGHLDTVIGLTRAEVLPVWESWRRHGQS